ncbi:MAG TPA: hypothetical protein VHX44_05090, partial [Planctomycetota bacterium]|nr:hypothetical protein [Planctomycetota bacterium]
VPLPPAIRFHRRASLPPTVIIVFLGGPVSSFDPPLSRSTATILIIAATLVFAWVLYAAQPIPAAKSVVSTGQSGARP